ncbi:hypothetical protein [Imhoffiella purpurea]|nr:hypothetical protein [Imhoffiella purpurea]
MIASIQRSLSNAILIIFALSIALLYLQYNHQRFADDSFITFRYAQNLAEGYGLRFNPEENHYGSTAMGMAILLGGLSYLADIAFHHSILVKGQIATHGVLIPIFASMFSAASIGLTTALIFLAGRRTVGDLGAWPITIIFSLILVTTGYIQMVSGHETLIYLALLFFAAYLAFFLIRPVSAGLVLALATTIRPDSILMFLIVAALMAIHTIAAENKRDQALQLLKLSIAFAAAFLSWLLFCKLYFGQALPETMLAKQAQIILGHWETYRLGLVAEKATHNLGWILSATQLLLISAAFGLTIISSKRIRDLVAMPITLLLTALLLFGFGQALFYHLIGVTVWPWYITPIAYTLIVSGALSAFIALHSLSNPGLIRKSATVILIISAVLLSIKGPEISSRTDWMLRTENINHHVFSYDGVVQYLRREEPNGCSVATAEPGALGFKLGPKYRVIDELGLSSPDVAKQITLGNMDYPFETWHPDYVIVSWQGKYSPDNRPWFKDKYELATEIPHQFWQERLGRGVLLYKRRESDLSQKKPESLNTMTQSLEFNS